MQKEKASPIRFLRSDKTSRIKESAGDSTEQVEQHVEQTEDLDEVAEAPQFDAAEFIDPVNILDNLPKNFYDDLLSSKWKERKEALDALLVLVKSPKLEDGRYSELVSALAKRIQDANVVVVILAAQCIDALACGLRTAFSTYHSIVIGSLLERCKEKKTNVLEALRSALDHVFATMGTISDVTDEIVATMTHKNPQIKLEGVQFLTRCLKVAEKVPAKQEIKALAEGLSKIIDDADAGVRDASAEAMGTLMKLVGERPMAAFIDKLDSVRCTKVREYFATAQIKKSAGGNAKAVAKPIDGGKENTAPVSQRAPVNKSKSSSSISRPRPGSAVLY
jgi:cytoskeleton-associated protein 5